MAVAVTPESTSIETEYPVLPDSAFDKLFALRDREAVYWETLPKNHPLLPGDDVVVAPYYMLRGDPRELGVWRITAANSKFKARVYTAGSNEGIVWDVQTPASDGRYAEGDQTAYEIAASIISGLDKNVALGEIGVQQDLKRKRAGHMLKRLLRRK